MLWRLAVCFVATALLLAPLLVAELRFSGAYDPATKNEAALEIWNQFIGFGRYLVDAAYRWSTRGQIPPFANFVQIDYAIWVPITAALLVGVVHGAMRSNRIRATDIRQSIATQGVPVFLGVSLAVYLFLQLKVSDFVYRLLTPLQVINFPWRMLALITPIGIILLAAIADGLMRRHPSRALWWPAAGVWLASLLLLSPVFPIEGVIPGYFPVSAFTAQKTIDYPTFQGYFSIAGFPPGLLYPNFSQRSTRPMERRSQGPRLSCRSTFGSTKTRLALNRSAELIARLSDRTTPLSRPSNSSSPCPARMRRGRVADQLQRLFQRVRPGSERAIEPDPLFPPPY